MKDRAGERVAIRAFLRVRSGRGQEPQEQDPSETCNTNALKYARHANTNPYFFLGLAGAVSGSNRYPTHGSVWMYLGWAGSGSIFFRN